MLSFKKQEEKQMKKKILAIGVISIFLLLGFSSISVVGRNAGELEKNGTVYGPYRSAFMVGDIELTEDAVYSSKFNIGGYCIYRDLILTGYVDGMGPPRDGYDPFEIGNHRLSLDEYQGMATLTIGFWIGLELNEETGSNNMIVGRLYGSGFNVQLEF